MKPNGAGAHCQDSRRRPWKRRNCSELSSRGWDQWQTWSWKVKTAGVPNEQRLGGTVACDGVRNASEILKYDEFVDVTREKRIEVVREMYSVLATHVTSEASTIARTATEMDGVESWRKLRENFSRRTLGRMFRVQRGCVYPKSVKERVR